MNYSHAPINAVGFAIGSVNVFLGQRKMPIKECE